VPVDVGDLRERVVQHRDVIGGGVGSGVAGPQLPGHAPFWRHLGRAARAMRLYGNALHTPHPTAADLCRLHLAAASDEE
jgi:hypothetical protein